MRNQRSDGDLLGGRYYRDAALHQFLRENGVPFSDAGCSFVTDGRVFDAVLIVPGEHALAAWLVLRNLVPVTGLWPVICAETTEPSPLTDLHPFDSSLPPTITPEILREDAVTRIAEAKRVPPTPWFFRGRSGVAPEIAGLDTLLEPSEPNFAELFSNSGPFRCTGEGACDSDWEFHPFLRIRLYPTAIPWEVFAYSPFGGWNEAPWPEEQLTMLRHWHELYGAEIVSLQGDWYELFVARPPRTRHEALRLAAEMQWFGEETIFGYTRVSDEEAAERLRRSHYWYFWWD